MASSKGPLLVLVAGLVVVGAGAAGWFLFNKSEPAIEPMPAEPVVAADKVETKAPTLAPKDEGTQVSETVEKPDVTPVREYYVDGKKIRDHRPESYPPMDLPPAIHPPDGRKIQPESTQAVTRPFKELFRECTKSIPAEEKTGAKPKMEATIAIGIKDKQARITKVALQLRDAAGPATDAAKSCIEARAVGLSSAVEEADVESYDITTSYVF